MTTIINDSEFPSTIACLRIVISLFELINSRNIQSPVLLLACWWAFCLYLKLIVLNIFPLFILIWFSFKWKNVKRQPESSLHQLMIELEQRLLGATQYLSWEKGNAQTSFIYLIYIYIVWISLQQILPLSYLFILLGSFIIVWKSEWASPLKRTYTRMKHCFTQDNSQDRLWNRVHNCQQDGQQSTFVFEIYENQRLNVFTGQWEGTVLPFERSPWTDSVHFPISSKSQIVLPHYWNWTDGDWSADDWSYSTIIWTTNAGIKWYHNKTRRRMWTRIASTVDNGLSRRRSSIFYSQQKSTICDTLRKEETITSSADGENDRPNQKQEEDALTINNAIDNNRIVESPFRILKPQHESLYNEDGDSILFSHQSTVSTTTEGHSSYRRWSKKVSLTTTIAASREAIWKSIV